MISVQEASATILNHLFHSSSENIPLLESVGKVLAESVHADRDFPPFNRVTMDGIAIRFQSWREGRRTFYIDDVQSAGQPMKTLSNPDHAMEVMTGAMLPAGTDTVVRYEDLKLQRPHAEIVADVIVEGQSVHRRGADAATNALLLEQGTVLSAAEIAVLASVGKSEVRVKTYPKAAVVSTGDELVDIHQTPLDHQVRRSNTYALAAAMRTLHWSSDIFHFPDHEQTLLAELQMLLAKYDVIILSGGVSQGKFDFIPSVLTQLGVAKHFHQVAQRPGKPLWFGTLQRNVVFALPGNPVSTFLCFYRYIKPWLFASLGSEMPRAHAVLAEDFSFTPNLSYFLQVSTRIENGVTMAFPVAGGGSGDFVNLKNVDGFLELPADRQTFKAGEVFHFIPFRL